MNENKQPLKMLTCQEAGNEYGVAVWAIRTWVNNGQLPAVKTGRKYLIAAANLERFLLQGNTQPETPPEPPHGGKIRRISE